MANKADMKRSNAEGMPADSVMILGQDDKAARLMLAGSRPSLPKSQERQGMAPAQTTVQLMAWTRASTARRRPRCGRRGGNGAAGDPTASLWREFPL